MKHVIKICSVAFLENTVKHFLHRLYYTSKAKLIENEKKVLE